MCRKRAPPQTTSSREPEVPRDLEYGSEYARRRFNIEDMTVRVVQCAACFRIGLPAAERNKAQRTCRTKLDVQEPFGATSGRAVPPRSLAWPELSCTAGAITTFWAITALGRSKCSRTSLQRRTELQPLRAPRHPLRAAALSRQRFAAAFRTDKASPRLRCLHPAAATHVCTSYRSGAHEESFPTHCAPPPHSPERFPTARRRHALPRRRHVAMLWLPVTRFPHSVLQRSSRTR